MVRPGVALSGANLHLPIGKLHTGLIVIATLIVIAVPELGAKLTTGELRAVDVGVGCFGAYRIDELTELTRGNSVRSRADHVIRLDPAFDGGRSGRARLGGCREASIG